ncbi:MAG: DUF1385 domain-containing protein [Clostridia bacterium]|nr:DUF1385 domain-containing protein [Clostridia bacterium]
MAEKKSCPMGSVGGQALIEGVMMNGPGGCAISVRKADGSIVTEMQEWKRVKDKAPFLGWPFIRGVVNYIETMIIGYKSLMKSAELSGQLEAEEDTENMSKLDRWLNDHMGPKMLGVLTAIASVIAVAIGVFLFMWLPTFLVDLADVNSQFEKFHALFEGLIRAVIIVGYMFIVSRLPDIHRVFQYHGAEHKSIACLESGMDLKVENVAKCKRFHPRCGTSFIFVIIIVSMIVSSVVLLAFPVLGNKSMRIIWILVKLLGVLPVVTSISYEFIKYAGKHNNIITKIFSAPGLWMQRITTAEPDDSMMEVAIASIKAVLPKGDEDETYVPDGGTAF